jgi:hypothetical protein
MDKELLFKPRLPEADVEVPGIGTVRVRGLSRAEALAMQKVEGTDAIERKMLAVALIDPVLTEAEVGKWQKASVAGELEPVGAKVQELSGMAEGAAKATYKEFEADPAAEFRLPPSGEARDDGDPAEG